MKRLFSEVFFEVAHASTCSHMRQHISGTGRKAHSKDYSDFSQYPDKGVKLLPFAGSSRPPLFPYSESRTNPAAMLITAS